MLAGGEKGLSSFLRGTSTNPSSMVLMGEGSLSCGLTLGLPSHTSENITFLLLHTWSVIIISQDIFSVSPNFSPC